MQREDVFDATRLLDGVNNIVDVIKVMEQDLSEEPGIFGDFLWNGNVEKVIGLIKMESSGWAHQVTQFPPGNVARVVLRTVLVGTT